MYLYNEVLPYGDQLIFFMEEKQFAIADMHCLTPKCTCTESVLIIGQSEDEFTPIVDISVDFKKKTWQVLEGKSDRLSLESFRSAIEEQIPDLYQQLRDRQARVKSIYKHCRQKNYIPEPRISSDKIGRNDPCFCGSGKKYKKCCMK
ncbi:MAG: SEC-C domain-containing protein [Desulfobacteraceae bacterium]|nr:SEC-C domain-containing protein [Desulfobacteraceae bacterium]